MAHKKETKEKWSSEVTEHSDALDLEESIFTWNDPKKIAASLKNSTEKSKRKKGRAYQSAMSMLTFYINRDVKNLGAMQKKIPGDAKEELRELLGRKKVERKNYLSSFKRS